MHVCIRVYRFWCTGVCAPVYLFACLVYNKTLKGYSVQFSQQNLLSDGIELVLLLFWAWLISLGFQKRCDLNLKYKPDEIR